MKHVVGRETLVYLKAKRSKKSKNVVKTSIVQFSYGSTDGNGYFKNMQIVALQKTMLTLVTPVKRNTLLNQKQPQILLKFCRCRFVWTSSCIRYLGAKVYWYVC